MNITVSPSELRGQIDAPSSKSLTQRAIAAGLLAGGTTLIINPSLCNDSMAAMTMARALGASVTMKDDRITMEAFRKPADRVFLNCGESGLALRMFSPLASVLSGDVTLTGEGSLLRRPVKMIGEALSQLGVTVETSDGLLPVRLKGKLKGGRALIDGSSGSQLLTGLLMALPLTDTDSRIDVANLTSRPYISLTLDLLADFGIRIENEGFMTFTIPGRQSYRAHEYRVEGDWSGAAFLLVGGATGGRVSVGNLNPESRQADMAVLSVLEEAGAVIAAEPGRITSSVSQLRGFTFDATDAPDLFPPLAALAAYCEGVSTIRGVGRLRHKESDRAEAIAGVLEAMRIEVRIRGDEMIITGGKVQGAVVSSHNDHRIAMMAAVMAAGAAAPVTITGAEAVAKSYPGFFDDLARIGGKTG
ncbi:MAG: 3-phosphoshikimate 1-carboxyvinyltransferase [Bacteroidales bacterium]|jgi:3-phosphoshikimate 1-carboxyvinyltransferase|nr:3-phosphoshikimate 1-carboxyvinyltransferase [Bacteroidales bacterium]